VIGECSGHVAIPRVVIGGVSLYAATLENLALNLNMAMLI